MPQKAKIIDVSRSFLPIDPNALPENMVGTAQEDTPEKEPPILLYEGYNFLPTSYGYRSWFGTDTKLDIGVLSSRCDYVIMYQTLAFENLLVAMCEDGIWTCRANSIGLAWTHQVTLTPPPAGSHKDWSYTLIENKLYMYRQGDSRVYRISPTSTTIDYIEPTFLNMSGQMGIFRANGRLGFWDSANSISWSSLFDLTDFVPSLTTLVGSTIFNAIVGRITLILPMYEGFVIYSTKSVVGVRYTQTGSLLWDAVTITNKVGVAYRRQVTHGITDKDHYIISNAGVYELGKYNVVSQTNDFTPVFVEVYDFLRETKDPIYITCMAARYLCFSLINPKYINGLVSFESQVIPTLNRSISLGPTVYDGNLWILPQTIPGYTVSTVLSQWFSMKTGAQIAGNPDVDALTYPVYPPLTVVTGYYWTYDIKMFYSDTENYNNRYWEEYEISNPTVEYDYVTRIGTYNGLAPDYTFDTGPYTHYHSNQGYDTNIFAQYGISPGANQYGDVRAPYTYDTIESLFYRQEGIWAKTAERYARLMDSLRLALSLSITTEYNPGSTPADIDTSTLNASILSFEGPEEFLLSTNEIVLRKYYNEYYDIYRNVKKRSYPFYMPPHSVAYYLNCGDTIANWIPFNLYGMAFTCTTADFTTFQDIIKSAVKTMVDKLPGSYLTKWVLGVQTFRTITMVTDYSYNSITYEYSENGVSGTATESFLITKSNIADTGPSLYTYLLTIQGATYDVKRRNVSVTKTDGSTSGGTVSARFGSSEGSGSNSDAAIASLISNLTNPVKSFIYSGGTSFEYRYYAPFYSDGFTLTCSSQETYTNGVLTFTSTPGILILVPGAVELYSYQDEGVVAAGTGGYSEARAKILSWKLINGNTGNIVRFVSPSAVPLMSWDQSYPFSVVTHVRSTIPATAKFPGTTGSYSSSTLALTTPNSIPPVTVTGSSPYDLQNMTMGGVFLPYGILTFTQPSITIPGYVLKGSRSLPGMFTESIPGSTFIIQDGSIEPMYPTYEGSLVYDMHLKKWGKYCGSHSQLVEYTPINLTSGTIIPYDNFGFYAGILDTAGSLYLFNTKPSVNFARWGKVGLYRLGYTQALEVKVHFRSLSTGTIIIDASLDGRGLEPALQKTETFMDTIVHTFKFDVSARWFTITLSGQFDLQFMEFRGNIVSRR
jgi:hypothetical protein